MFKTSKKATLIIRAMEATHTSLNAFSLTVFNRLTIPELEKIIDHNKAY